PCTTGALLSLASEWRSKLAIVAAIYPKLPELLTMVDRFYLLDPLQVQGPWSGQKRLKHRLRGHRLVDLSTGAAAYSLRPASCVAACLGRITASGSEQRQQCLPSHQPASRRAKVAGRRSRRKSNQTARNMRTRRASASTLRKRR